MEFFYQDCINYLEKLHNEISDEIESLPIEAFDWVPNRRMNSICQLGVHIAGAERYWSSDVLDQQSSGRDRSAEFSACGLDREAIKTRLAASLECFRNTLSHLRVDDLGEPRLFPRDGSRVTVNWAIQHLIAHTATHLGHIQLTRQLWEQNQRE